MKTCKLCWSILTIKGNLPEELIVKILFHFGGLRHPIAYMLFNSTKVKEFEDLQKLPFSKSIYKFYLNEEKYSNLFNMDIITYINNKQYSYFKECKSYINYSNPGFFIPRQFGKLYYNTLNDNDLVETKIDVDWKLNRSKKIYFKLRSTKAIIGGILQFHLHSINKWGEEFEDKSYVYKLMALENYFEDKYPNTYLKQYY